MPSKILHATRDAQGFHFLVHLDTDMTVRSHECHELSLAEGAPHPHFVRKYDWPNLTPGVHQKGDPSVPYDPKDPDAVPALIDLTEAEYLASIEAMLTEQIALELQGIRFYQPAPKAHCLVESLHGKEL